MRIAITGKAGSGKDEVAKRLIARGHEVVRHAGGLKAMTRAFLAYRGVGEDIIERMIEGDLKEVPTRFLGGKSPRKWMQILGTDFGRKLIHPDLWVDTEADRGYPDDAVCMDVRFDNEGEGLIANGRFVILRKLGGGLDGEDGEHESEQGISERLILMDVPWFDDLNDMDAWLDELLVWLAKNVNVAVN